MDYLDYVVKQRHYSLEFKHQICREHIEGKVRLLDLVRKYGLSSHSLIHDWLRRLGYLAPTHRQISRRLYLGIEMPTSMPQNPIDLPSTPLPNESEQAEIARLKKELLDAQIQLEGYQQMIQLAEKELKVSIRKKSNTK